MEVYTDSKTDKVERVVSTGNVRIITRDCRMGTAERAEYYDAEQRVVLIGNARVWRDADIVTGDRITIFIAEDRSIVEGGKQERVKAIFYQGQNNKPKSEIKFGPAGPICP
jgi:lipopolysaccharide export system protein LptA